MTLAWMALGVCAVACAVALVAIWLMSLALAQMVTISGTIAAALAEDQRAREVLDRRVGSALDAYIAAAQSILTMEKGRGVDTTRAQAMLNRLRDAHVSGRPS